MFLIVHSKLLCILILIMFGSDGYQTHSLKHANAFLLSRGAHFQMAFYFGYVWRINVFSPQSSLRITLGSCREVFI